MASVLKVSDAASMGLHAAVLLAAHPDRLRSSRELASELRVSQAHLAKVLQQLVKAGLARSTRGPGGGFRLADEPDRITLLKVYEAIEGRLRTDNCLLSTSICGGRRCIFGGLLKRTNKEVRQYLAQTKLSALAKTFRSKR